MPRAPKPILEAALGILARREHSVAELTRKLRTKGYLAGEIAHTITFLQSKNFLNDVRYAELRARTRAEGSKWGPTRIRQELSQNGITKDLNTTTLTTLSETQDWLANAQKLLSRKFPKPLPSRAPQDPSADYSLGGKEDKFKAMKDYQKEKAKRLAFLTRRGFTFEQSIKALNLTELDT